MVGSVINAITLRSKIFAFGFKFFSKLWLIGNAANQRLWLRAASGRSGTNRILGVGQVVLSYEYLRIKKKEQKQSRVELG